MEAICFKIEEQSSSLANLEKLFGMLKAVLNLAAVRVRNSRSSSEGLATGDTMEDHVKNKSLVVRYECLGESIRFKNWLARCFLLVGV